MSTSQCGRTSCSRSRLLPGVFLSFVSGSGQSMMTMSRNSSASRCTSSKSSSGSPSDSTSVWVCAINTGRRVVGRCRPAVVHSVPTSALTSELLPVPVPPKVATISGASSRMRSVSTRCNTRRTSDCARASGSQGESADAHWFRRPVSSSTSASISRWAISLVFMGRRC